MSVVRDAHEELNAVFGSDTGHQLPRHYGRPERTVTAVRNGVGVTERGYGVLVLEGQDRVDFVDNAVSNRVPSSDGRGCYALLLDPNGGIRADLYVYCAADRLLVFTPRSVAATIADEWTEHIFIQDVTVDLATDAFAVFGVHGPSATEKIASVLNGAATPESHLAFTRGSIADIGVTVIRTDAPLGEEGYEVVCAVEGAETVFDALLNYGLNAAPFGTASWDTLSLEAGTPAFDTELVGEIPNVIGLRNALDFEKGCYVGQEVVSRVENRGRPSRRLVGLRVRGAAAPEDAVVDEAAERVGVLTRVAESPTLDATIAFALVDADSDPVGIDDPDETPVTPVTLPFVDGSDRSARIPTYAQPETGQ